MKKTILAFLFIPILTMCLAQGKVKMGFGLSLYYPSCILGKKSDLLLENQTSKMYGVFGGALHVDAIIPVAGRSSVKVGAQLSYFRCNQKYFGFELGSDWDPVTFTVHKSTTIDQLTVINLEVPILYLFRINPKWGIQLGAVPQYRIDQKAAFIIHYDDHWKSDLADGTRAFSLNKANVALYAGIGYTLKLSPRILLEIAPFVQVNILGDELYLYDSQNRFYQAGVSFSLFNNKEG